jgi:hypothetical protein
VALHIKLSRLVNDQADYAWLALLGFNANVIHVKVIILVFVWIGKGNSDG